MLNKLMIFGAASAIATETAINFARRGTQLYLVDLKLNRVSTVRDHILTFAKTKIEIDELDANDFANHQALFDRAVEKMDGLDGVLIAHGTLPDNEQTRKKTDLVLKEFSTNCTSVLSLATIAANYFEEKNKGTLAVISSVAGDRGRQSNYIYGAAKSAITTFMEGLRNRLNETNVNVVTIKPGMVDTPMTAHMEKGALFSKPEIIGKGIFEAMTKGKDIVYLPGFWYLVMFIIRHIPESIFKKLKL